MMVVSVVVMVMRRGLQMAPSAVGMIVAVGIERDLIGHARPKQSDEGGVAYHGGRIAFAANMAVEADNVIGSRHDDVKGRG